MNCVAFAVAKCANDLQVLVDKAYAYSKQWQFQFSAQKCAILKLNVDVKENCSMFIGKEIIKESRRNSI